MESKMGGAAEVEMVAVGRSLRDAVRCGNGIADVLDNHWLAQDLAQASSENTSQYVCATACCGWDNALSTVAPAILVPLLVNTRRPM
jgi:hypothetical protein